MHIEKIAYLEKELQNHKTVFGTIGSESDLAKQVIIREQELQNLKTKYEGLEMVILPMKLILVCSLKKS